MIVIHLRNSCFICCVNLLDTGARNNWPYEEIGTGEVYNRSEGLAIALLDTFKSGIFSSQENHQFNEPITKVYGVKFEVHLAGLDHLGLSEQQLSLAQALEGGTWKAHDIFI
ncbi:10773_t:CDS:2 [Entrophospora sp. SA101]|nr:10773_t:CDS:2 [Entrophospora sp. SA101]